MVKKFKKPKGKEIEKKKEKRKLSKAAIISIIFGAIMIFSIAGSVIFDNQQNQNTLKYGEFKFKYVDGQYILKINKKEVSFSYFPEQLENINVSASIKNSMINSPQVIITFKPEEGEMQGIDLARFEIAKALVELSNKNIIQGVLINSSRYELPLYSCKNATAFVPVIYFEISNNTEIKNENNCIIMNAQYQEDFIMLKDRLLYSIYGIMS
jgi:hypothetical protein